MDYNLTVTWVKGSLGTDEASGRNVLWADGTATGDLQVPKVALRPKRIVREYNFVFLPNTVEAGVAVNVNGDVIGTTYVNMVPAEEWGFDPDGPQGRIIEQASVELKGDSAFVAKAAKALGEDI